jgi:radical SAM superfamily enzyme with C-terminal helix-hairpin-helix motif
MLKVTIIDGYVDEPTCLGVPPYISPYPRYIAGAIIDFDKTAHISYLTIDQIRKEKNLLQALSNSDLIIAIVGMSVPGRYLSGFPASPNELIFLMSKFTKPKKILTGPAARYGFGMSGGRKTKDISFVKDVFDLIIKGDGEIVLSDLFKSNFEIEDVDLSKLRKNASIIRNFAVLGSRIVKSHPNYPDYLIAEIETYRGCPRGIIGGCSFCCEPSKGPPDFRPIKDIIDEIKELYDNGVRHYRIGNQPCIFSYMAENAKSCEYPRPNPDALEKLFSSIKRIAPRLKTLHIDNANPGIIARFPSECKKICKTIIKYHTPGDVAAFGIESVDPVVISKNNLKASTEEVIYAIKLLNEIGSKRGKNGMPELLPGLNFVIGLIGETKNTYDLNYGFLKDIYDENLLVRRINLRQVIPIPGTKMGEIGNKIILKNKQHFQRFKKKVKTDIERPMLEKMLPAGSILRDIYTEKHDGKLTFGRQVGSYPLLIGIPGVFELKNFFDVKVVDYGYRSITAVPFPLDINKASRETIEALPGIGKKRAIRILANRPFNDKNEIINALDDSETVENIFKYITLKS